MPRVGCMNAGLWIDIGYYFTKFKRVIFALTFRGVIRVGKQDFESRGIG
jgi:hypothetical protein